MRKQKKRKENETLAQFIYRRTGKHFSFEEVIDHITEKAKEDQLKEKVAK